MKRAISINLGGIVFNIDDDAYRELQAYLTQIESCFSNREESKEIMNDIEVRIAELFNERITDYKKVITSKDVNEIIDVMGGPEQFGETEKESTYEQRERFGPSGYRRMYRDPDNRILGGVCSGMSAYWRIDPIILRILFVIAFLGFGTGLIIYIILWVVIPEAKTKAQKLEMMGEKVNVSNIGKAFKEEFNNVKKNMNL
ncbi:MAG: PspC domain-containing protein [Bacteroidales bacterium]|nr:PspC domain-containing protein [Bacteroidales bacterium]